MRMDVLGSIWPNEELPPIGCNCFRARGSSSHLAVLEWHLDGTMHFSR